MPLLNAMVVEGISRFSCTLPQRLILIEMNVLGFGRRSVEVVLAEEAHKLMRNRETREYPCLLL